MGLFDEFLFDFACPSCGKQRGHWQTQVLGCELARWRVGDIVDVEGLVLERAKVHIYDLSTTALSRSMPGQ